MPDRWFVARTKPGQEVTASVSVAALGYPIFLPVHIVRRTHARKVEQLSRPMFPRYIFVRFDPDYDYSDIKTSRGVASRCLIVNVGDNPVAVPDLVIEAIRGRERIILANAGEIRTGYAPGDTFQIQRGHAFLTAHYLGEEAGKVMAIVEFMGKGHIQTFDFEEVPLSAIAIDERAA
jgi:transcriptional antiterminator RfaH